MPWRPLIAADENVLLKLGHEETVQDFRQRGDRSSRLTSGSESECRRRRRQKTQPSAPNGGLVLSRVSLLAEQWVCHLGRMSPRESGRLVYPGRTSLGHSNTPRVRFRQSTRFRLCARSEPWAVLPTGAAGALRERRAKSARGIVPPKRS